jgi:hypothetical protein
MITGAPFNVLDFGADPTGATDSTAAIQACLDKGGANAAIRMPTGTYLISATLNGYSGQHIYGDGPTQTILRRFGDFGNTLRFTNLGSGSIRNIWFYHSVQPASGFTTLADKATTGSHLLIENGQGAVIEDCWFWRMPVQIRILTGSLIRINRVHAQGCWNRAASAAAQEGVSGIELGFTGACVLFEITNCYLAGANGGAQSISFVTTDNGTQVVNFAGTNAGNLYGIRVFSCEGLYVGNTYIGGNVFNNILFAPNAICTQIRISNNFFDGAGYDSPCVYFSPGVNGQYAFNVTVNDNVFNGQLLAFQAIGAFNSVGAGLTLACFVIDGNSFVNSLGSAIFLRNAQDGVVSSNQIASYNSQNLSPGGDNNFCNALVLNGCTAVTADGNIVGGAINSGATGGYTYRSIDFTGTNSNLTEKNTVHVGTGTSANIVGKSDMYVVTAVNVSYTCTGVEDLILTTSTTAPIQIFLPTNPPKGMTITVKDAAGSLTTNNIGVIGTIDGSANLVMSTNFMARTFTWDGSTTWNITAGFN